MWHFTHRIPLACVLCFALLFTVMTFEVVAQQRLEVPMPQPQTDYSLLNVVVDESEFDLDIYRADVWTQLPNGLRPKNGRYLVLLGTVTGKGSLACIYKRDFALQVGTELYSVADRLSDVQGVYKFDYPGAFLGQCLSDSETEGTYLIFDIPTTDGNLILFYGDIYHSLHLTLKEILDALVPAESPKVVAAEPPEAGSATQSTATATPTPRSLFEDPLRVCNALASYGMPPVGDDIWNNEGGLPYGCVSDDYSVTRGGLTEVGDVDNILTFYVESKTEEEIDKVELSASIFNMAHERPAIRAFQEMVVHLFDGLALPMPDGISDAILVGTELSVATSYGDVQLKRETYNMGYGLVLTIAPGAQALSDPKSAVPAAGMSSSMVVTATLNSSANLRAGPGTEYEVVGSAQLGKVVSVVGSNGTADWLQLASGEWVAAFLVTLSSSTALPTLPPSPTPTSTPTLNATATSRAAERANATATLEARAWTPPDGVWCDGNSTRAVCVGDFRYETEMAYTIAPSNGRYVAFAIVVANIGLSDISANPNDVTVAMSDGRSYSYSEVTFSYWADPFQHVNIAPGDEMQAGIVFLVPNDVAIERIIYRGGFWESNVTVDLRSDPTESD